MDSACSRRCGRCLGAARYWYLETVEEKHKNEKDHMSGHF